MKVAKLGSVVASEGMDLALRIAKESSIRQAALQTGISRRKIRETLQGLETHIEKQPAKTAIRLRKDNPLVEKITKEAITLGVDKASDLIKDRVMSLVDVLYSTAEDALNKTRDIVKLAGGDNPLDAWKVDQLKYLVSVWDRAIQSGKLLTTADNKEAGNVTNYNTIDARQIILSRIDRIAPRETKEPD